MIDRLLNWKFLKSFQDHCHSFHSTQASIRLFQQSNFQQHPNFATFMFILQWFSTEWAAVGDRSRENWRELKLEMK